MENQLKCPKCSGEMEDGLIGDRSHGNASLKQQWGTDLQWGGLFGVKDRHEIKTFRCKSCGYLESYAK